MCGQGHSSAREGNAEHQCIRKEDKAQVSNRNSQLKNLEKEEQRKPKQSRMQEIIQEINRAENKNTTEKKKNQ